MISDMMTMAPTVSLCTGRYGVHPEQMSGGGTPFFCWVLLGSAWTWEHKLADDATSTSINCCVLDCAVCAPPFLSFSVSLYIYILLYLILIFPLICFFFLLWPFDFVGPSFRENISSSFSVFQVSSALPLRTWLKNIREKSPRRSLSLSFFTPGGRVLPFHQFIFS